VLFAQTVSYWSPGPVFVVTKTLDTLGFLVNNHKCAPVAQGIERRIPNPQVGGSNPLRRTILIYQGFQGF
jgi:hypothetical protein